MGPAFEKKIKKKKHIIIGCGASGSQTVTSTPCKNTPTSNRTGRRYSTVSIAEESPGKHHQIRESPGRFDLEVRDSSALAGVLDPLVMDTIIAMRPHFARDDLRSLSPHTNLLRRWIDCREAHYPIEVYVLGDSCPPSLDLTATNLALNEDALMAPFDRAPRKCRHNSCVRVDACGGRHAPGYLEIPSPPLTEKLSTLG